MLAYCGLVCNACPIHLATKEQGQEKKREMRVEIARKINDIYKQKLKAEDVTDCDGCRAESGRLFSGCKDCQIRKCAGNKSIDNCAHCDRYACDELKKLFVTNPEARTRLDIIRNSL